MAAKCLTDLLPYLVEKRDQAEAALDYQSRKYATGIRGGKGYSAEQKAEFIEIEGNVRKMKTCIHDYGLT